MLDSLLTVALILTAVVGSGALAGRAASPGQNADSWPIVARSTILGVLLACAITVLAAWAWIAHHRWAGVRHTLFVVEGLSSLALGSLFGWITAYRLARSWHSPPRRSNRAIRDRAS